MKRIFEIDPWKVVTHEFKPEEKATPRKYDQHWKRVHGYAWNV